MEATVRVFDEDNEITGIVHFTFVVCQTCQGRGTHVNPSIDANGLSRADFDEDPDFEGDYFSGLYDVMCYEC